MYKILTLDKINPQGLDHFPSERYETGTGYTDPDAIILRSSNLHAMEFSPATRAIARAGAGYNNIPVDRCAERGIVVFNTPGANANGVKELVLAGLLLASRDISGGITWVNTLVGQGDQVPPLIEKGKRILREVKFWGRPSPSSAWGPSGFLWLMLPNCWG